jgi:ABC-type sugar transport system substrate-binding protein
LLLIKRYSSGKIILPAKKGVKRMKKITLFFLMAAVIMLTFSPDEISAGGKKEVEKKEYVIGVSMPILTHSYWIPLLYGIRDEAQKLGIKVIDLHAGGFGHLDVQINQIENLMQQGVDALLVGATSAQGVVPIVEEAIASGIPVIGVGSQPATDKVTTKVVADDYEMGVLQAKALGGALKGSGEVVMLAGPPGNNWSVDRAKGFKDTVAKDYPGMKVAAEQWTDVNRTLAADLMETWIQGFPNVRGVYSANDDLAAGAVTAIVAAGKSNQIKVSSSNPTDIGMENLKKGLVTAFAVQQTVLQGREGVRAAFKAIKGEPTQKKL